MRPIGLIFVALLFAVSAQAEDRPLENQRMPPIPGVDIQSDHVSKLLFLNRCAQGCSIQPGVSDARFNTSSIVQGGTASITPWRHGDESWERLVECVKEIYAPYDVQVTDVDPGSNVFHHEAIVAGDYTEINYEKNVGGVAPSQCRPANNVISFSFANGFDDPIRICHIVGQETAHSYGLEHAMDCSDPMTYLTSCGRQFFRDVTSACGEYEALPECLCGGGNVQNTHRWLVAVLGKSSTPVPGPEVEIQAPANGGDVASGFRVEVVATHMRGLSTVELRLNGSSYETLEGHAWQSAGQPYRFTAPSGLSDGVIDIEVIATNDIGSETIETITVTKGLPCANAGSCAAGQQCEEGRCFFPAPTGELGDHCALDSECISGLCPIQGEAGHCSEWCFPTPQEETCSTGFECIELTTNNGVCWPLESKGTCGCRSGGSGPLGGSALIVLCALVGFRRRRNRSDSRP